MCLNEKLEINSSKGNNLTNERSELISKIRDLKKHRLLRHDRKDYWQRFSCKSYRNVTTNIASQSPTDVLNSRWDKTSIKQLQVAVPLGINTMKRVK